jgi:hypothetical protein
MKNSKTSIFAALGIWTGAVGVLPYANAASAAEINWNEYIQSSFLVSAISAAISRVENCSKKPLLIEEIISSDDKRTLVFTCEGTEDEEGSSILHIERFGDGPWLAKSFEFAG